MATRAKRLGEEWDLDHVDPDLLGDIGGGRIGRVSSEIELSNRHVMDKILLALTGMEQRIREEFIALRNESANKDLYLPLGAHPSSDACSSGRLDRTSVSRRRFKGQMPHAGSDASLPTPNYPSIADRKVEVAAENVDAISPRSGASGVSDHRSPESMIDGEEKEERGISSMSGRVGISDGTRTDPMISRLVIGWTGWPGDLEWREQLEMAEVGMDAMPKLTSLAEESTRKQLLDGSSFVAWNLFDGPTDTRMHVLHPDSRQRWVFDVLSLLMLVVDAVYTPYSMSFETEIGTMSTFIMFTIAFFWFADLWLSFCTGYHTRSGEVELRLFKAALHYLRTHFFIDFVCVAVDLTVIVQFLAATNSQGRGGSVAKILRVAKLQRFLRVLSMVRMVRVMKKVNAFMETQVSQVWRMVVLVLQLCLLLLWLCHILACIWYAIGQWAPEGSIGRRWLENPLPIQGEADPPVPEDQSSHYHYVISYQWALAQISLGAMDVMGMTECERMFTIFCNVFGLIIGGALVSILSTTLMELRELNQEKNSKLSMLREYLLEYHVSLSVRMRVLQQVKERVNFKDHVIVEKDVKALQVLSHSLLKELRYDVFSPCMLRHPMFLCWESISADVVRILCNKGLAFVNIMHEDELFVCGGASHRVFYVVDGKLSYTQDPQENLVKEERKEIVHSQTWICEATWWCYWVHVGTAIGRGSGNCLCVSPDSVLTTMSRHSIISAITLEYARQYHIAVTNPPQDDLPDDIHVPCTDFRDLIGSSSKETHVVLSCSALEHYYMSKSKARHHLKLDTYSLQKLLLECQQGRSLVLLDHDGLWRSVSLTCLEFESEEGQILVEVAELAQGHWKPCALLPGAKRAAGETYKETLKRLLTTRLSSLSDAVTRYHVYRTHEAKASEHYGIGTQYSKTICKVRSSEVLEELLHECAIKVGSSRETSIDDDQALPPKLMSLKPRALPAEDVSAELRDVCNVFRLSGSTHTGLYIWMSRFTFGRLQRQEATIAQWVTSITSQISKDVPSSDPSPTSEACLPSNPVAVSTGSIGGSVELHIAV